jgi:hypothetical protein
MLSFCCAVHCGAAFLSSADCVNDTCVGINSSHIKHCMYHECCRKLSSQGERALDPIFSPGGYPTSEIREICMPHSATE